MNSYISNEAAKQSRVHACGEGRTVPNTGNCWAKAEETLLFWSFLVIQQSLSAFENKTKRLEKLQSYFLIVEKIKHLLFPGILSTKRRFFFSLILNAIRKMSFFLSWSWKKYLEYQGKFYGNEIANVFILSEEIKYFKMTEWIITLTIQHSLNFVWFD